MTAVTRRPGDFPIVHPKVRAFEGDVRDRESVARAVAGHDAVVCTVGVHYTKEVVDTYSRAAMNLIDAARRGGPQRLVCVSSMGADGRGADPRETFVIRRVVAPVLHLLGRTIYVDMARMEGALEASGLDWLVVRPSGLFDTDRVNAHELSEERLRGMFTSRADLAHVLVEEALSPSLHRTFVDLVTRESTPRYRELFVREALGVGKEKAAH